MSYDDSSFSSTNTAAGNENSFQYQLLEKKRERKRKHWMQIIYQVQIELIKMENSLSKLQSILNFLMLLKFYSRRLEHQVLGIEPIPLQYIK